MDNQRLLVWGMFGFLLFLTWQTWLEDNAPPPVDARAAIAIAPHLPGRHREGRRAAFPACPTCPTSTGADRT